MTNVHMLSFMMCFGVNQLCSKKKKQIWESELLKLDYF